MIDPLAEKYLDQSQYNYVLNDPFNAIDTNGMDVYAVAGGLTFTGIDAQNLFKQLQSTSGNQQDKSKSGDEDKKDGKKDSETKNGPSLARQFLNGAPVIGSALSSGDKLKRGDSIGAAADFGYALSEMFTLGYASEYKIAGNFSILSLSNFATFIFTAFFCKKIKCHVYTGNKVTYILKKDTFLPVKRFPFFSNLF